MDGPAEEGGAAAVAGGDRLTEEDAGDGSPGTFIRDLLIECSGGPELLDLADQVVECEDECGEIDTRTLERLLQLGHACENASQFEVALEVHFALKDAYADLDEPESFASELTSCGEISRKLKRYDDAEAYIQEALEIREEVNGKNHPHTAFVINVLASIYAEQGKFDLAQPLSKRAMDIFADEMLSKIGIRCLDDGKEVPLSAAERFIPPGTNPIELHSIEEILATCMIKDLDSGKEATLDEVDKVVPKAVSPLALRTVDEALATMVIKDLDTGVAMTMDMASGLMVPVDFAPVTEKSKELVQSSTPPAPRRRRSSIGNALAGLTRSSSSRRKKADKKKQAVGGRMQGGPNAGPRPASLPASRGRPTATSLSPPPASAGRPRSSTGSSPRSRNDSNRSRGRGDGGRSGTSSPNGGVLAGGGRGGRTPSPGRGGGAPGRAAAAGGRGRGGRGGRGASAAAAAPGRGRGGRAAPIDPAAVPKFKKSEGGRRKPEVLDFDD